MTMDTFTRAYIECALWSSTEDDVSLDQHDGELAAETLAEIERDCVEFQAANAALLAQWYELGETEERAGHDFWLTRVGHGAGFWDRYSGDPGEAIGDALIEASKAYGSRDLYIGDDGLIYQA